MDKVSKLKKRIVFDLDDTLLVSSWTHHHQWACSSHVKIQHCWPAFTRRGLVERLRRTRGVSRIVNRMSTRDCELVEIQLRPGTSELLRQLKKHGHSLALWTASARDRVEFLRSQIPQLFKFFVSENEDLVFAAEDTESAFKKLNFDSTGTTCGKSVSLHQSKPASLAQKTPLLFSIMCPSWSGYDLLVDDSKETRSLFEEFGLDNQLIPVNGDSAPLSNLIKQIGLEIAKRIDGVTPLCKRVDCSETSDIKLVRRYLDPLYIPTLKRSLELESHQGCYA